MTAALTKKKNALIRTNGKFSVCLGLKVFTKSSKIDVCMHKRTKWVTIKMYFHVLSEEIFIFPENMTLLFRWKMKDHLPQKNTWKYISFISCKDGISFSYKYDITFLSRKQS